MIQPQDDERIKALKEKLRMRTKVDVVRAGLALLESEAQRQERVERGKKAAAAVAASSREVNQDFQRYSRIARK
jgi:hypothetical protein